MSVLSCTSFFFFFRKKKRLQNALQVTRVSGVSPLLVAHYMAEVFESARLGYRVQPGKVVRSLSYVPLAVVHISQPPRRVPGGTPSMPPRRPTHSARRSIAGILCSDALAPSTTTPYCPGACHPPPLPWFVLVWTSPPRSRRRQHRHPASERTATEPPVERRRIPHPRSSLGTPGCKCSTSTRRSLDSMQRSLDGSSSSGGWNRRGTVSAGRWAAASR